MLVIVDDITGTQHETVVSWASLLQLSDLVAPALRRAGVCICQPVEDDLMYDSGCPVHGTPVDDDCICRNDHVAGEDTQPDDDCPRHGRPRPGAVEFIPEPHAVPPF